MKIIKKTTSWEMKHKRNPLLILFIFSLVFGVGILSCGTSELPTPMPTLTLASSDYVRCGQVTPISSPIFDKPRVIYVLIDRSGSYGSYTKQAIDVLIDALVLSVQSGDRLHLIWLGETEDESKYWLVATVPEVGSLYLTPPVSTLTPSPIPISTPLPTETPVVQLPAPVLRRQAFQQTETALAVSWTVTADASNVIATNNAIQSEEDINQQHCDQFTANSQNQFLIESWQKQRDQTVKKFVENTLMPMRNDTEEGDDNYTHIYNSLYYATRTIRQEKETGLFGNYYLIILSDMQDIGSANGMYLEVDLAGVNVLMAMVPCNQSLYCQNRENYWESYFLSHGAILPIYPFRLIDETTPYVLSDFLK